MKNMADVILAEQTLEGFAELPDRAGIYVFQQEGKLFSLTVGEKYSVTWNGASYECTAQDVEGAATALGNLYYETLEITDDTGEPFLIFTISAEFAENDTGVTVIYTTDTDSSNTIEISSLEDEDTENVGETTGVSITLYNRTGVATTYDNVETLTTDTPDAENGATFTYGVAVENAEYTLDFTEGNQKVSLEKGQLLKEFTMVKPENLLPEYIKKNIEVAGVVGEFAGDETEKTVELNMADGEQIIEADEDTVMTKITVKKPDTLLPENILNGIDIGGVLGTYQPPGIDEIVDRTIAIASGSASAIGSCAFAYCRSLETIDFPDCQKINNAAFSYCDKLGKASFPKCSYIGALAFACCSRMTTISFPACSYVGSSAFLSNYQINKIMLPSCSYIGSYAFQRCSAMMDVILPVCSYIGTYAFQLCSMLTNLYLLSSSYVTLAGSNAFYSTPMSLSTYTGGFGTIYVPSSMLASYKTRTYWSYYSSRFYGLSDERIEELKEEWGI